MARANWLPRLGALAVARSGEAEAVSELCATLTDMRVVIADDHRLVLDGIKRALEADGGFEIVGETQTGTQVLPLVGKTNPDSSCSTYGCRTWTGWPASTSSGTVIPTSRS